MIPLTTPLLTPGDLPLDAFDALSSALEDPRPHPTAEALGQLGAALMGELLDTLLGTALEDFATPICETFIGGLHAGAQRVEREADRARDSLARLLRDFDGSEVADDELQQAKRRADAADVAVRAIETVREAAADAYAQATGETWSPWRGSARAGSVTAAQLDAQAALRALQARRQAEADPGRQVVAFRAAPQATGLEDARRIFDALNWALGEWPEMTLALTGAPGGERLALRWAQQKRVRVVLARPQFDRHGRAAPFRANDDLMALEPVCVLVLARSLDPVRAAAPFGPALNLMELAQARAVRCVAVRART
ncbi:DUF2493 domain-containing protein [Phenylobacterium deserti]|uniref:DUF2493 domain-containing protein n=1 Tax=Phenylobacterium deserti TaxID=1914756 RepID=A0A328ACY8_9CAUL|nr:DUF2493 domain-containing protein [Phenylobacterium deserti]RAK52622.1 DUF2493 domain-containing protein [Phenylobacterium deserti]